MTSRVLSIVCAVAALSLGAFSNSYAQPGGCDVLCLPNGTPVTCQVNPDGSKVWVDAAGNTYPGGTGGTGTFEVTQCDPAVCQIQLTPRNINITSTAGPLGVIQTRLDPTRPSTPAIINGSPGTFFPATETFSFFAEATSSAYPGAIFRSIQELRFIGIVTSFNPHRRERFTQQGRVDFENIARPGVIVFSLSGTNITLN